MLEETFGDMNAEWTAQNSINRLKQGNNGWTHYAMKFKSLAVETGYDENALKKIFYDGL